MAKFETAIVERIDNRRNRPMESQYPYVCLEDCMCWCEYIRTTITTCKNGSEMSLSLFINRRLLIGRITAILNYCERL